MVWPWQRGRGGRDRRPSSRLTDPSFAAGIRPIPVGQAERHPAANVCGVAPDGAPVSVTLARGGHVPSGGPSDRLLLAFLHVHCDGCEEYWRGFADPGRIGVPDGVSLAVVTKGPGSVAPDAVAHAAAGIDAVPVVMSDQAWSDYRVLGYPFFVLVELAGGTVVGETVGFGWADVLGMVASAG